MAEGSHPFPFRTRPLSPPAPMVLSGRPGGRVGRCRDFFRFDTQASGFDPEAFRVSGRTTVARDRRAASVVPPRRERIADLHPTPAQIRPHPPSPRPPRGPDAPPLRPPHPVHVHAPLSIPAPP